MINEYDIFTKEKTEISYCSFIQTILIELGLSPTSKGTYYLRDIIVLALQEYKFKDITLIELRNKLAIKKHTTPYTIKSNIDYTFKMKDTAKAEKNFEKIFKIKYDEYYITAKALTNLIVSLIYM